MRKLGKRTVFRALNQVPSDLSCSFVQSQAENKHTHNVWFIPRQQFISKKLLLLQYGHPTTLKETLQQKWLLRQAISFMQIIMGLFGLTGKVQSSYMMIEVLQYIKTKHQKQRKESTSYHGLLCTSTFRDCKGNYHVTVQVNLHQSSEQLLPYFLAIKQDQIQEPTLLQLNCFALEGIIIYLVKYKFPPPDLKQPEETKKDL